MMKLFLEEKTLLCDMCDNIVKNKEAGIYDGAYKGRGTCIFDEAEKILGRKKILCSPEDSHFPSENKGGKIL